MPTTVPTERIDFRVRDTRCAAWLALPPGSGPHPAVVLVHGLGATHDMMLPQYEQHFAAAGIATLAFDYRYTGASDGQPRQHISTREQCHDVAAALEHLKSRPEIDGGRVGLWGTSLGGMNVIRVAAARDDIAVAVVQCPIVHGPGAARRLGLLAALRLTPAIAADLLRLIVGRGRRYVPIVGPPGSLAMVTVAGAESGWNSTVPPGFAFDNRIVAADAVAMVTKSATRHARRVDAPLLVCVCDRENLTDPADAALVARRAPRGVARHYASDHFEIYHPPLLARVLADEFSADEWSQPSLCDGWSIHDVLAHLVVGYGAGPGVVASEMLRHGGSFDRANAALACSLAATRSPAELLYDFARLTERPRGLGRYFPRRLLLGDHITHELDLVFALGREPAIPADALVAVLNTQVSVPNPFVPAFRNSRGLRLSATDADWTHGVVGPTVRGRAADLVSVLGNRPAMLVRLAGDGVEVLASRVSSMDVHLWEVDDD